MSPHQNAEAIIHAKLGREPEDERSQAFDFSEEFTGFASTSDPEDKMKAEATTSNKMVWRDSRERMMQLQLQEQVS